MSIDKSAQKAVVKYYSRLGSRLGYRLVMKKSQHFGYYKDNNQDELSAQNKYHEEFAKKLDLKPGMKLLDAGCGQGVVAVYLTSHYDVHVTGITITPIEVKSASRIAKQNGVNLKTDFIIADYAKPPFLPNSFDRVYTTETLSHAPDVKKVVKALLEVLKPGGKLVFAEYEFDFEKFDNQAKWSAQFVKNNAAIHGIYQFGKGNFFSILKSLNLELITETDWTKNTMPSFERIRRIAKPIVKIVKLFRLEKYFVNSIAAAMYAEGVEAGTFKYKVYTAFKKDS